MLIKDLLLFFKLIAAVSIRRLFLFHDIFFLLLNLNRLAFRLIFHQFLAENKKREWKDKLSSFHLIKPIYCSLCCERFTPSALFGLHISQGKLNHLGIVYWITWSYDRFPPFSRYSIQIKWWTFSEKMFRALEIFFFIIIFWLQPPLLVLLSSNLFLENEILLRMPLV